MRVLVVEDEPKISLFIANGLRGAGFAVDCIADGEEALASLLTVPYDLAVMDVMLPSLDGLTVIGKVREKGIRLPVIILSAKHSVDDRIAGLQNGGDDYLVKPFALSELLARVQALLRRAGSGNDSTRLEVGEITLDLLSREVWRAGKKIELHARELSLLECLMRNPGRVLSKSLILEKVWNYDFDPQTNAVDVLVCRLRGKLDKGFKTKSIHTMRGLGYVLKPA